MNGYRKGVNEGISLWRHIKIKYIPIQISILLKKVNMILVIPLGGFSEEAEVPGIKYLLSPYKLNLVATPLFLKPGIPYSIKVD